MPYLTYYRRTRHPGYIPGVQPPTMIPMSGLVLWLKPESLAALADNDPISTWSDVSGQGNDATSTLTLRPTYKTNILNGYGVARFDGSNDELSISGIGSDVPSAAHLFIVATVNDTGYNLYNHGNVDSWWRYTDGNGYLGAFRSARINSYPATMPSSGTHRFELQSSAGAYHFYLDGSSKTAQAGSYAAGTNHTIGRADDANAVKWFTGDIAEIILYSSIQSAANITTINSYLVAKYAL